MLKKGFFIFFGLISVFLGVVGILLPILPTTPFLLFSAFCFLRSSPKLYNLLVNNRYLGSFIRNYQSKAGIPLKTKIIVLSSLWLSIIYSIFVVNNLIIRVVILLIAIFVSYHILKQKTLFN